MLSGTQGRRAAGLRGTMARGKGAPRRSARPRVERQQASSPLQSLRLMMQLPSWVRWSSAATATSPTTTRREAAPSAEARAMDAACRALGLSSRQDVQDFLAAMVLSECVYKGLEMSHQEVADTISHLAAALPPGWCPLDSVQLTLAAPGLEQHYLVATGGDAMYVAFMGTKQARDVITNMAFLQEAVWAQAAALAQDQAPLPAAHRGFLARARAVDVEGLAALAAAQGRRLVLCGHSLGGAVAKLAMLRLLRGIRSDWGALGPAGLRCICFASPAIGNAALADLVDSAGWSHHFKSYYLPEDQLMRLVNTSAFRPRSGSGSRRAAHGSAPKAAGAAAGAVSESGAAADAVASSSNSNSSSRSSREGAAAAGPGPGSALDATASMEEQAAVEEILAAPEALSSGSSGGDVPSAAAPSGAASPAAPASCSGPSSAAQAQAGPGAADEAAASSRSQTGSQASPSGRTAIANIPMLLALQRRRALQRLSQLAARSNVPMPHLRLPYPRYHSLGAQLSITPNGVRSVDQLAALPPAPGATASAQRASLAASAASASGPGDGAGCTVLEPFLHRNPFGCHRMSAHRYRVLEVIAGCVEPSFVGSALRLPWAVAEGTAEAAAEAAAVAAVSGPASGTPEPAHSSNSASNNIVPYMRLPPTADAPGSHQAAAPEKRPSSDATPRVGQVQLSSSLYPQMTMAAATAKLPLPPRPALPGAGRASSPAAAATSAQGSSSSTGLAANVPKHSGSKVPALLPRPLLPSGEAAPLSVRVRLQGANLRYCQQVTASLVVPAAATGAAASSSSSMPLPVQVVQPSAPPAGEAARQPTTGGGAQERPPPPQQQQSRQPHGMGLLYGAPRHLRRFLQAARGATPSVMGSAPLLAPAEQTMELVVNLPQAAAAQLMSSGGAAAPGLLLQLRNDFQLLPIPVQLQPYRVGILAASPAVSAQVQALLAEADAQPGGGAAALAGPLARSGSRALLPSLRFRWVSALQRRVQAGRPGQPLLTAGAAGPAETAVPDVVGASATPAEAHTEASSRSQRPRIAAAVVGSRGWRALLRARQAAQHVLPQGQHGEHHSRAETGGTHHTGASAGAADAKPEPQQAHQPASSGSGTGGQPHRLPRHLTALRKRISLRQALPGGAFPSAAEPLPAAEQQQPAPTVAAGSSGRSSATVVAYIDFLAEAQASSAAAGSAPQPGLLPRRAFVRLLQALQPSGQQGGAAAPLPGSRHRLMEGISTLVGAAFGGSGSGEGATAPSQRAAACPAVDAIVVAAVAGDANLATLLRSRQFARLTAAQVPVLPVVVAPAGAPDGAVREARQLLARACKQPESSCHVVAAACADNGAAVDAAGPAAFIHASILEALRQQQQVAHGTPQPAAAAMPSGQQHSHSGRQQPLVVGVGTASHSQQPVRAKL